MNKTIIILRGGSGVGKTTYADKILPQVLETTRDKIFVCSADHFFTDEEGNYQFDKAQLGEAHKDCRRAFTKAVIFNIEHPVVVVDNTNTRQVDMAFYYGLGSLFGTVEIHELTGPSVNEAISRSVHNTPAKAIKRMFGNLQHNPVPRNWDVVKRDVKVLDCAFQIDEQVFYPEEDDNDSQDESGVSGNHSVEEADCTSIGQS